MIYDISPLVSPSLAVWPGDTPVSREVLLDMNAGDTLTLSTLRATVHAGAHVDAPSHYGKDAPSIDAAALERYLGPCHVLTVPAHRTERIPPNVLRATLDVPRVLLRTGTYPDPTVFTEDFAALSVELVGELARRGVTLVGVDTPSVDLYSSKDLVAHHACLREDIAILEGLVLAGVPDGVYELLALPLKLAGFDASPVRAILRANRSSQSPSAR